MLSSLPCLARCWKDLTAKGSTLRADTKKYAEENFDRAKEVKKYIKLYEGLLSKKNKEKEI